MTWTVEESQSDPPTYDVSKDGRPVRYDCDDLYEVEQVLRQHGADSFTLVERDGYRTPRTIGR